MTSKYIIITIHIRNLEILQLCGTKWMYISIFKSAILLKIVWKVIWKISLKGMNWYDFSKASFGFYMTWGFQNYAWFFRDIFWNSYFVQARCVACISSLKEMAVAGLKIDFWNFDLGKSSALMRTQTCPKIFPKFQL